MSGIEERDLRERFAELREDDQARVPGFTDVLARKKKRTGRPRPLAIVLGTGALAAVIVAVIMGRDPGELVPVSDIVAWTAPSDELLPDMPSVLGPLRPLGASVLDAYGR